MNGLFSIICSYFKMLIFIFQSMAEEAEPLRESGEGVTAAGPAAGLQSPATVRGKPRRERERECHHRGQASVTRASPRKHKNM